MHSQTVCYWGKQQSADSYIFQVPSHTEMHERSIIPFLRLFLSFEMNFSKPRLRSDGISRGTRATTVVCRHKQLYLSARQTQQHSLSCIWEILNAG